MSKDSIRFRLIRLHPSGNLYASEMPEPGKIIRDCKYRVYKKPALVNTRQSAPKVNSFVCHCDNLAQIGKNFLNFKSSRPGVFVVQSVTTDMATVINFRPVYNRRSRAARRQLVQKGNAMINVVDLSHHYGVRPVLSHINFTVPTGQLVAIMGPNGVGKSTLLGAVAGTLTPARGYVEIAGLRRRSSEDTEIQIRKQTVFLPDHPWLPEFMTAREWLLAVGQLYDIESDHLMDHVNRLLDLFQLSDKGDSPIRTCSNGQKKKVAICGALVTEVPVMVLDEPFTGGLDPSAILVLTRVLRHLADESGATILMASQVPETVEQMAHQIIVISNTRLAAYDTLDGLRAKTGCKGSLPEVFAELVHPQTLEHIENYFNRPAEQKAR
jgi:ABC-2 type transport system ATP-binding protein